MRNVAPSNIMSGIFNSTLCVIMKLLHLPYKASVTSSIGDSEKKRNGRINISIPPIDSLKDTKPRTNSFFVVRIVLSCHSHAQPAPSMNQTDPMDFCNDAFILDFSPFAIAWPTLVAIEPLTRFKYPRFLFRNFIVFFGIVLQLQQRIRIDVDFLEYDSIGHIDIVQLQRVVQIGVNVLLETGECRLLQTFINQTVPQFIARPHERSLVRIVFRIRIIGGRIDGIQFGLGEVVGHMWWRIDWRLAHICRRRCCAGQIIARTNRNKIKINYTNPEIRRHIDNAFATKRKCRTTFFSTHFEDANLTLWWIHNWPVWTKWNWKFVNKICEISNGASNKGMCDRL